MISETLSLKTIKSELDFLRKRLKIIDLLLLVNKLIANVPGPCNVNEYYDSFLRKKNKKSVAQ